MPASTDSPSSDAGANNGYNELASNLDSLMVSLASHPSVTSNAEVRPQSPSQPAPRNKILYMYDFVARTREMQKSVDPSLPRSQKELWMDVVQRSILTSILVNDTSGKLSMMTFEKPGEEIDFGSEIKTKASTLVPEILH